MIDYVKFASLPVDNQDRALAFYTERLGLTVAQDQPYQNGQRWIELAIPGARTRIWFAERPDPRPSQVPSMIMMTSDVRATHADLEASGVQFTQPPAEAAWNPGETVALFRDSEGNLVMLSEIKS